MKRVALLFGLICMVNLLFAQNREEQAAAVLEKLSQNTKAYSTMAIDFTYTMVNSENGINESQQGRLLLEGEKYRLELAGQIVISDGETMWSIMPDSEEVSINEVEEGEEMSSPKALLGGYYENFRCRLNGKESKDSDVNVIEMSPKEDKSFYQVILKVGKADEKIRSMEVYDKNGSVYTYIVDVFKTDQPIAANQLTFIEADYSDFDIIDMR